MNAGALDADLAKEVVGITRFGADVRVFRLETRLEVAGVVEWTRDDRDVFFRREDWRWAVEEAGVEEGGAG